MCLPEFHSRAAEPALMHLNMSPSRCQSPGMTLAASPSHFFEESLMRYSVLPLPERRTLRPALLAALTLFGAFAALGTQVCPVDKTTMMATGETRHEDGKTLAEYKCEKGHTYWIAVD
jgi:hypothetical protein